MCTCIAPFTLGLQLATTREHSYCKSYTVCTSLHMENSSNTQLEYIGETANEEIQPPYSGSTELHVLGYLGHF